MSELADCEVIEVEKVDIPDKLAPRYAIIDAALQQGIQPTVIAKGLGVTRGAISHAKEKLNKKYDLTSKKMVELAGKAHKMMLQAVVEPEALDRPLPFAIKGADVNACIDRSYDRVQPKVNRNENLNIDVSISPVDYERLRDKYKANL